MKSDDPVVLIEDNSFNNFIQVYTREHILFLYKIYFKLI
jgi:hypothetical protein